MIDSARASAFRFSGALLLLGLLPGLTAAAGQGRERLDAFLAGLTTLSAEFEQQVIDEAGTPLETSHGTLRIARPGKFSWVYTQPYRQTIVSDGATLWLYDEELAQVTVNAVQDNVAGSAAQLLGEEVDLDAQYEVTELGMRDGVAWVKLRPLGATQQYTAVEIGLDPVTLQGMRLTDNLGQTTELRFSHLVRNPPLDPAGFSFEAPPGVDVVTGAGAVSE